MHSVLPSPMRRLLVLAAIAATVTGSAAWRMPFHLRLLKSMPQANATVASAPDSIRLWFSQTPELQLTTVKVTGAANATVPLTAVAGRDSAEVVVGVKGRMASGAYVVTWRTMARDGHIASGSYAFTIAATSR